MKNTNSLSLTTFLLSCLMASPVLSLAQTQCNLGSITLNVVNLTPDILGNSQICPGNTTELSISQSYSSYLWSTGATSPSISVNAADIYTVTVTNAAGCTATDEFQVIELTAPIPDITSSYLLCNGQATLDAGAGFATYAWSNNGITQTIAVTSNGIYTVTVTNSTGCSATDEISVSIATPPVVAITGNLNFCSGGNSLLTATPGFSSYSWTGGSTGSSLTVTAAGTYSVTATAANGCTANASVMVTTTTSTPPTISGNLEFCQGGSTTITAEGAGFNSFVWSSGQNTPGITVSAPGNYTVTASASNGCTGTATATIQSVASATTSITGNTSICNGGSTTLSATGNYASYTWSNGMTGQNINVNQAGTYSVTVSAAQGCTGTATATVTTGTPPVVDIAPIAGAICVSDAPFNLSASPSGGVWGGNAGAGGSVNPATLGPGTWSATYAFTDANGCTGSDQLTFQIDATGSATIASAGPFCPTDGVQVLAATPAGGTWGGAANALGQFNPTVLGPGIYSVTYEAAATGNCASFTDITITVNAAPSATISGSGTICDGSGQAVPISIAASGNGPLNISYTIDGTTPTTLIAPAGTANLNATAAGVYEIISVTDVSGCVGNGSGQAIVNVVTAPIATGVDISCDAAQTNYQVVFGITGGDPASYSVTSSITGTLSGPPYNFTSALIPSGSSYEFVLTDANGCNPITLEGSFNCSCGTNAGSLDASPLVLCVGEMATALTVAAPQLEPNDVVRYYLHDGNGNSLGTVFGTNSTPNFNFASPLVAGQTYYISAVAGDDDGTGGVDLNDPCHSVSIGTPVSWEAAPTGSLAAGTAICMGETASLVFSLSGTAPFDLSYSDGSQILVLQNILDNHSLPVSPTTTTTYTLVSLEDSSPAACSAAPGSSAVIVVNTLDSTTIQETSCVPSEVGVFTNVFTNQNGCDSTVVTTVSYQPYDEVFLNATTCDPAMAGVFTETLTNQNGCDSIVTTTVTLLQPSQTQLTATTCDPTMAGVFTETFTNQNGCDSIVTTTVTLLQPSLTQLTATTCDPALAGVFTETLTNQDGCDSVVVTTISLLAPEECSVSFQLAAAVIPCGINEGSISIEVELGQLPLAYSYSGTGGINGSGEVTTSPFSLPPLPAGQYSVTLSSANGLSATETVEIVQATPPTVAIELLNGIPCSGEPVAALSANVLGAFPPYSLAWSNGATTPIINGLGAGSYEVIVTGDFGCAATATMTITELPSFEIGFTVSDPDCFENSNGSVTISVVGGQQPYQFSLNNGVFQADSTFDDLTDGAYQVTVEDGNGCKETASFAINAPLTPSVSLGDDMTIEAGDGVTIQAIVNLPDSLISSVLWTGLVPTPECPTCLDQPTVPLVTSTYSIVVESVDGCTDSDDITVVVKKDRPVYVPNAFSPNGDGINDEFYLYAKEGAVANVNNFLIFNRWGDLVFEAYDFQPNLPEFGWDGTHREALMDADVFTWYAEIKFKDGQVQLLKGDVMLVR